MKYISDKSDVPATAHWALLEFDSIYIPGDERSRTNPGHGYPASSESTIKYIAFDSLDEMNSFLQKQLTSMFNKDIEKYSEVYIQPKSISMNISVK